MGAEATWGNWQCTSFLIHPTLLSIVYGPQSYNSNTLSRGISGDPCARRQRPLRPLTARSARLH